MRISNPLQMNDWEISKFLRTILCAQFAMWGAIGLDAMGLQMPALRQFVGFIYLMFVPGVIIIRILRLHRLGNIKSLIYSIGLSIAVLMSIGWMMNTFYPIFGIHKPISLIPLISTISAIVLMLSILCYLRDREFSEQVYFETRLVLLPYIALLGIIPSLAVIGTYLANFHHSAIILMLMIAAISALVLLIGFDKFVPKELYPLAVFIIAISLLLHTSLISMYIWGWDIQIEYYLANIVIANSFWNSTFSSNVNGMLSIVMLTPIFSIITGMSTLWIFKIVYPLLFCLSIIGLYEVFQKQTDDKIAFLSCFFITSVVTFYSEMPALARQEIAELFLVLLILTLIDKNMDRMKRSLLSLIFGISLVISHYGITYIFIAFIILAWLVLIISENWGRTHSLVLVGGHRTISLNFILFFIVFALTWYMNTSNSSIFESIVRIGDQIIGSIYKDFLNPEAAEGLRIMLSGNKPTLLSQILVITNYLNQIFILIGIIVILKLKETKFENEYISLSILNLTLLFASLAVPFLAGSLGMTRIYHIALIFLAPFTVIGGITFLGEISKWAGVQWWGEERTKKSFMILSIYFVIFMLYQTGFIYEAIGGPNGSIALNSDLDSPRFNIQEVLSACWLTKAKSNDLMYADGYRWLLLASLNWPQVSHSLDTINQTMKKIYIYLGSSNLKKGDLTILEISQGRQIYLTHVNSSQIVVNRGKIYNNDGSQVYY